MYIKEKSNSTKLVKPKSRINMNKVQAYATESGNTGCIMCNSGCYNCNIKGNCFCHVHL